MGVWGGEHLASVMGGRCHLLAPPLESPPLLPSPPPLPPSPPAGESELRRPAPLHVDRRIPDAMLASVDGLTSAMGAAGLNGQPHAMLPPPHGGLTTSFDDRAAAAQAAANGGGMPLREAPPAGFQPRALPAGVPEGPRPQEAARPKTRLCIHFERGR